MLQVVHRSSRHVTDRVRQTLMVHNRTLILYRCLAKNLPGYNSLALDQGQLFNELGYLDVGGTDVRAASVPACNRESL